MILYFDTETTSLYPGQICQLSYVMQRHNMLECKNFFFSVNSVDINAQLVHGFSKEKLEVLSSGKTFSYHAKEIFNDFSQAKVVVAHNVAFDISFLRAEFERLGIQLQDLNTFCTMKKSVSLCKIARKNGGYKYPKLVELCSFLCLRQDEINNACIKLFGSRVGFHDARFDTVSLYLLAQRGMQNYSQVFELQQYIK